MELQGFGEQYALKQKRGFVGERLYIVHSGDDGNVGLSGKMELNQQECCCGDE